MADSSRITQNPAVMAGSRVCAGMRVTVRMIVGQISAGGRSMSFWQNART